MPMSHQCIALQDFVKSHDRVDVCFVQYMKGKQGFGLASCGRPNVILTDDDTELHRETFQGKSQVTHCLLMSDGQFLMKSVLRNMIFSLKGTSNRAS